MLLFVEWFWSWCAWWCGRSWIHCERKKWSLFSWATRSLDLFYQIWIIINAFFFDKDEVFVNKILFFIFQFFFFFFFMLFNCISDIWVLSNILSKHHCFYILMIHVIRMNMITSPSQSKLIVSVKYDNCLTLWSESRAFSFIYDHYYWIFYIFLEKNQCI